MWKTGKLLKNVLEIDGHSSNYHVHRFQWFGMNGGDLSGFSADGM